MPVLEPGGGQGLVIHNQEILDHQLVTFIKFVILGVLKNDMNYHLEAESENPPINF